MVRVALMWTSLENTNPTGEDGWGFDPIPVLNEH